MSFYDLSLSHAITKDGKPFTTQQPHTWHGLNDTNLGLMIGLGNSVAAELKKAAGKGGPISVSITNTVVALDGGPLPPNANTTQKFDGLTRHGLSDVQDAMDDVSKQLRKWGRQTAEKREGKRGQHGRGN